ncbi:hypothetical protein GH714_037705 [Hevea brasiliensis]|uniref:Rx N-terminal domain-containing protein n=1 Tax=Hevea brasiliensis TaxID=3981 RepID=A0A6A6L4S8_HEVBR|nr:hypothetical protein GH714_037705 [Hevea brasiliensis]
MADFVLSFVVDAALSRVASLITDEIILAWNLKDDLKGLQESLTIIRAVLQDTEEQQTTREPVRLWLKKLQEADYDAEDVFDELAYENLRRKVEMQDQSGREIKNEAMGFGLQAVSRDRIMPLINLDRVTDSVLDNPVVGREADVAKIVNLLSCSSDQQVFTIVPIVGMGGLGKTALAKLVWEMLQTLNANMGGLTNKDAILQELEKALEGKKFILVLDDVWNDVVTRWDDIKIRLEKISNNNGNAIVVTTRSEEMASKVKTSTSYRHKLNLLSDDECWSIVKERALGNGPLNPLDSNLGAIGKETAKKCRGVPLAAIVLGGTMGFNRDKNEWLLIEKVKF